jgi:polysaccharide biosynthesis protein PslJ
MSVLEGSAQRGPVVSLTVVLSALALLTLTVVNASAVQTVTPVLAIVVLLAAAHKRLLQWRGLIAMTILVILLIPIRRYTLPASLPFNLEPYRVLVAFVLVGWICSLLVDPRVRLRASGLEPPLAAFGFAILASLFANPDRVASVAPVLNKQLMFFASYLLLFFLIVSVVTKRGDIDLLSKVLVTGGALVGVAAIVQSRTGYNVFDHLSRAFPFLNTEALPFDEGNDPTGVSRGGRIRAYGSAQHPIALGAALAMLLPIAVYLAYRFRQARWWIAAALLVLGEFATVSRTGILMLIVVVIGFAIIQPRSRKWFMPAMIPAVVVIHFAVPGTLGTLAQSFFPEGGLIAQQKNQSVGSGRLATLGPVLRHEFLPNPVLGEGFSTRIVEADGDVGPNAVILDDQWAGILVETGIVGALSLAWLFIRFVRRWGREAKRKDSDSCWLLAAVVLSLVSYGIGMFTFDAFSFVQVTFLFFIILGLGAAAYRLATTPDLQPS